MVTKIYGMNRSTVKSSWYVYDRLQVRLCVLSAFSLQRLNIVYDPKTLIASTETEMITFVKAYKLG